MRHTFDQSRSLWLVADHPAAGIDVDPRRWADYRTFYVDLRRFLDEEPPARVHVEWRPFRDFPVYPKAAEEGAELIEDIAALIADGEDVPPLLRGFEDENVDGHHRAYAAAQLGRRVVPTIMLAHPWRSGKPFEGR